MPPAVPIGIDDFRKLREAGLDYVDKSDLVRQVLDLAGVEAMLVPRPRRFGKTLNLSMLRAWFEKRDEDLSRLFQDLSIWHAGDAYRAHFQRYPVIHFNFKGTKAETFERCWAAIRENLIDLYREHRYLLDGGGMDETELRRYRQVVDGSAERTLYERALLDLSSWLHRHHGERVVILVDEYDEPVYAGHAHGYTDEILDFMRAFLSAGLKSNAHLFKAVMTGILRVAKESLFSGLNNLGVYTLLRPELGACFGFTEAEVRALLERHGRGSTLDQVRGWYNGYLFGGEVVYNPWSLCSFVASRDAEPRPYWLNTSSNDLVRDVLGRHALTIEPEIEALLGGSSIERKVDDNVVLRDLHRNAGAAFDLLLFSGYLRAEVTEAGGVYRLTIPNREVREVYATTFQRWMEDRLGAGEQGIERLKRALFEGDADGLAEALETFTTRVLSYHDLMVRRDRAGDDTLPILRVYPEQVMHVFVLGLLATLEPEYEVRSNRESGLGRPDVMIRARSPGRPGVVLELKIAKPKVKSPEAALREGIAQIRERGYLAELHAAGSSPVHAFAVAFDGKRVRVRSVAEAKAQKKRPATKRTKRKS